MKKITLLGDSVRISYGNRVSNMLGKDFVVYQPEDNCRYSKYTLRLITDLKAEIYGSDIIHWNNGLWDTVSLGDGPFTPEKEYIDNMLRIARKLKECAKVVVIGIYVIECTACGIGCQHIHSVLHTLYLLVHIHCARTVILGCSEAGGRALDGTIGLAATAPAIHTILKVGVGQQAGHL